MELKRAVLWIETSVLVALSTVIMTGTAAGQSIPLSPGIQEAWEGVVINSDFHRAYSISIFGLAELESPQPIRNSEYFAGLRVSRSFSEQYRLGLECLQDRFYLSNSALFLENRCAVDLVRRWVISPNTRVYLRPKVEFRSYAGTFDQRLKIQTEVLRDIHILRGTFRGYIEPAIDQRFHGFEKVTVHTGMLWSVSKRVKVELFNSVSVAKQPDIGVEALGMIVFVQLRNRDTVGGEVIR